MFENARSTHGRERDAFFQLRITPAERDALHRIADTVGLSAADVTRRGWKLFCQELESEGIQLDLEGESNDAT